MPTVNENYPKQPAGNVSDLQLKAMAIQQYETDKQEQPSSTGGHKFPTEIIELPSKGLFYPKDNPLSSGKIEMKYMTAREEDILTTPSLIKQGVVLDRFFHGFSKTLFNSPRKTIKKYNLFLCIYYPIYII